MRHLWGSLAINPPAHPEKPAEFEAFIKAETAKWGPVVKQSGATVD